MIIWYGMRSRLTAKAKTIRNQIGCIVEIMAIRRDLYSEPEIIEIEDIQNNHKSTGFG